MFNFILTIITPDNELEVDEGKTSSSLDDMEDKPLPTLDTIEETDMSQKSPSLSKKSEADSSSICRKPYWPNKQFFQLILITE